MHSETHTFEVHNFTFSWLLLLIKINYFFDILLCALNQAKKLKSICSSICLQIGRSRNDQFKIVVFKKFWLRNEEKKFSFLINRIWLYC